jgi:methyl-accepting chemotaxis protein
MRFSDLKIGLKLGLSYAVLLLLTVVMAASGIVMLNRLNDQTRDITQVNLPRLLRAASAGSSLDAITISVSNLLSNEDEAARKSASDRLDSARKQLRDDVASLEKTLARAEVKAKLLDLTQRYLDGVDKILRLQGEAASQGAALAVLNKEVLPIYAGYRAVMDDISQFQIVQSEKSTNAIAELHDESQMLQLAIGAGAVVLGVLFGWIVSRGITRPISHAVRIASTVAAGDLTQRIEAQSKDETGQLLAALRNMNNSLARTVAGIRVGAETISTASSQISAGNTDLSSRTEEQAASLEETAASMEELASTVKQNADNARQANQLAASASKVAERGGAAVSEVVDTMQAISASSGKISEIVSVIDSIAFQTNILALNAAVEAARAGEQGKGFAVVASEVRSLAQRSASAAREVKNLIEDSAGKVSVGAGQVERAGATMHEIVGAVKHVTDIMGEIAAASEEQASGIEQVNRAVSQMDEVTQQNAALVEEAAAAAGALQDQANALVKSVSAFKVDMARDVIDMDVERRGPMLAVSA